MQLVKFEKDEKYKSGELKNDYSFAFYNQAKTPLYYIT